MAARVNTICSPTDTTCIKNVCVHPLTVAGVTLGGKGWGQCSFFFTISRLADFSFCRRWCQSVRLAALQFPLRLFLSSLETSVVDLHLDPYPAGSEIICQREKAKKSINNDRNCNLKKLILQRHCFQIRVHALRTSNFTTFTIQKSP